MKRNCPHCGIEISYASKNAFVLATKKQSKCRICKKYYSKPRDTFGSKNPFFGKSHTKESKEKITKNRDYSYFKTKEFREKMSKVTSGCKNAMYGRSVYSVWVEKYGEEEANKRLIATKKKHSKNNSGSSNPMYNKPSPQGSGNGWKGWYKNIYFRSLRELCFLIDNPTAIIISNLKIEYKDYDGTDRTYRPDFKIGNLLIEIKPAKLFNSVNNTLKFMAAEQYCVKNNLSFLVIDYPISGKLIRENIDNLNIKFHKNYLEKFEEYESLYAN